MAKDNIIFKILAILWEVGAKIIFAADSFLDKTEDFLRDKVKPVLKEIWKEIAELADAGLIFMLDIGAAIVTWWDITADIIEWFFIKLYVMAARELHDIFLLLVKYRKSIVKHSIIAFVVAMACIGLFSSVINYEYSYNGRRLGIVAEQRDVLEILDLVSEELSQEYGSNITIDPETDITFRPVFSYGKDIDDADTVLKRFTYMGDIQVQSTAIVADGETLAIVDSEKTANEVLDEIKKMFIKKDKTKYEYVGFVEDVKLKPKSTILARVNSKAAAVKKIKSGGQKELTYTVKGGDTLYGICEKLGVSLAELKEMNPQIDDNIVLHAGDKFVTQKEVPLLNVKTIEVSSFAESVDYEVVYKESSKYYKNDEVVSVEGSKGKAKVTARITKENGKTVKKVVLEKEIIQEPVDKVIIKGTRKAPPKQGTGAFQRPVNVAVYRGYGMRWGRMHYGLDYAAPIGTPIHAADGGTVAKVGWSGAYGNIVKIDHGGGFVTLYAHCSRMYVSPGDKVFKGQIIGAVGNTGRSTGPHCHFEIFKNGSNVNPAGYV